MRLRSVANNGGAKPQAAQILRLQTKTKHRGVPDAAKPAASGECLWLQLERNEPCPELKVAQLMPESANVF